MSAETIKIVGDRLRDIRQKKGLTQEQLAKKTGISRNYYARIERGDTGTSMEIFENIIKALKTKSSRVLPY